MTIIFGAQRDLLLPAFHRLEESMSVVLVRSPEQLSAELIDTTQPSHVVLPDWSWRVPEELLGKSSFIGFHAADLPSYRGGSPLQHQILDGLKDTKLTCFRMTVELDGGEILDQQPLSLEGSIGEIWQRITDLVPGMVRRVIDGHCVERQQPSGGFTRQRRTPDDSEIVEWSVSLSRLYDLIRAVDDPYPNAFIRLGDKRLTFRAPRVEQGAVVAEVRITCDGSNS